MMKVIVFLFVLGCWENKNTTETQNYGTTDDPAEVCSQ
jgi:hypothetical protein